MVEEISNSSQKQIEKHRADKGEGKEVSMLIHSVPKESANNSIYLKHPGDGNEDLSEEERNSDDEAEQKLNEESFQSFIDKHKKNAEERIKKNAEERVKQAEEK